MGTAASDSAKQSSASCAPDEKTAKDGKISLSLIVYSNLIFQLITCHSLNQDRG